MRTLPLSLILTLLSTAATAASVELRPVDGGSAVVRTETAAVRSGGDDFYERLDAQFRASYYFGIATLAAGNGQYPEAATLLARACEADPASALLWRDQGSAWEAVGKEGRAAECFAKSLELNPDDMELRQSLARLHLRADRKELAQSLFLNADGSDPQDAARLRSLIGIDISTDDLTKAEQRLRRLLALKSDKPMTDEKELLALTLQRQERWEEAAAEFRSLLAENPGRATSWARLAACEDARGDSAAALQALEDGLRGDPESLLLMDLNAKALYRLDRYVEAEAAYDRLLKADPGDKQGLLYRGMARLKQKRFGAAQEDFSTLGELDPNSPSQLYGLGLSYLWQGQNTEAEKAFQKVLALNPKAVPAYTQLAFLYDKQGKTAKAVALLKKAHKNAPDSIEVTLLLAAAHMDAKNFAAAEDVYLEGLKAEENRPVLRFQLAVLYDKWDRFPDAEKTLKTLLEEEPKNGQALNYLGYSWVERGGDLVEAERLIRRALEAEPGNPFYQDSLGWALFKQGRTEEALSELQAASGKILADAEKESPDAEEAVVLDHLSVVRESLGQMKAAEEAKAAAEALRQKAAADDGSAFDPVKEPDL